jgi:hypothetical protein
VISTSELVPGTYVLEFDALVEGGFSSIDFAQTDSCLFVDSEIEQTPNYRLLFRVSTTTCFAPLVHPLSDFWQWLV